MRLAFPCGVGQAAVTCGPLQLWVITRKTSSNGVSSGSFASVGHGCVSLRFTTGCWPSLNSLCAYCVLLCWCWPRLRETGYPSVGGHHLTVEHRGMCLYIGLVLATLLRPVDLAVVGHHKSLGSVVRCVLPRWCLPRCTRHCIFWLRIT